jgi:hypothetical protein
MRGSLWSRENQLRASIADVGIVVWSCTVPCIRLPASRQHRMGFTYDVFALSEVG